MEKEGFCLQQGKAKDREAAQDLMTLLDALPPGQKKQLLQDEVCGRILAKYGVTEE